jgi:hypothetical protein
MKGKDLKLNKLLKIFELNQKDQILNNNKLQQTLFDIWDGIKIILRWSYEFVFFEKPWYKCPLRLICLIALIFVNIANIEIRIWPRKFTNDMDFCEHIESIVKKLKDNNQQEWAGLVFQSLYISQSFYERQGELLRVLPALKRQKFIKNLKLKNDINKAISYLNSFPKGVI